MDFIANALEKTENWLILDLYLTLYRHEIETKTDISTGIRHEFIYNLYVGKGFLTVTQNPVAMFKKLNKFYYTKKNFAMQNYVKERKFGRKQLQLFNK